MESQFLAPGDLLLDRHLSQGLARIELFAWEQSRGGGFVPHVDFALDYRNPGALGSFADGKHRTDNGDVNVIGRDVEVPVTLFRSTNDDASPFQLDTNAIAGRNERHLRSLPHLDPSAVGEFEDRSRIGRRTNRFSGGDLGTGRNRHQTGAVKEKKLSPNRLGRCLNLDRKQHQADQIGLPAPEREHQRGGQTDSHPLPWE